MSSTSQDNTLFGAMERYYKDKEGNTLHEAVQLGMSILHLYTGFAKVKQELHKANSNKGGHFDDLALSMLMENFDAEAFGKNRVAINSALSILEGYNLQAAQRMREWIYSNFVDVISNAIVENPLTKIPMQLLITEGFVRQVNAYIFSGSEEYMDEDVAYANYQCSMHSLSFLAFMCSEDINTYFKMNLEVEAFMNHASKKVLKK